MNNTENIDRKDPLIDAYRQASEREGGRPGAHMRAAVLAHARVVAASMPSANEAARDAHRVRQRAVAANEPRPLWRLAAGVVIGLVGVWIFQLTRPAANPDVTVASIATTATSPTQPTEATPTSPIAAAPTPAAGAGGTAPAERARGDAQLAMAQPPPSNVPPLKREAQSTDLVRKDPVLDARAEQSVALAKTPGRAADLAREVRATEPTTGAPVAAGASLPDRAASETMIASAETQKSTRAAQMERAEPSAPASSANAAASAPGADVPPPPSAFPANAAAAATVASAALPMPSAPPAPVASAAPTIGAAGSIRAKSTAATAATVPPTTPLTESDQALFKALLAGDLRELRAAIARGANVNARDERGRGALQVARERGDADSVRALEAAGAR